MNELWRMTVKTSALAVIIANAMFLGNASATRQVASGQPGWGTLYNDTDQIVTVDVFCGTNGPKRTFSLLPKEALSLREYSRYKVDFPGSQSSYLVDAKPPVFEGGVARKLSQWQIRFYHIRPVEDGRVTLHRGVPTSLARQFQQKFKDSLSSAGIAEKLSQNDPVIWRIIQEQLVEQTLEKCLADYMDCHIPLRFEFISDDDDARTKSYLLNINTGRVPLSPEIGTFVARCIAAAYRKKVKQVTYHSSAELFRLLATHLAPAFRDKGQRILVPNIIKLVQEQLQESNLRAAEMRKDENGIVVNTDWLRATEVPKSLQGADVRWRLHIKAIRNYSEEDKQDFLDYDCVVQVKSKPRSASPNKYRMITVPSDLLYKLEDKGKVTNTALETVPSAFERRIYQILTGRKEEKIDSK